MSLTAKQEAFCVEYIKNGCNASAAYRSVYTTKATDKTVNEEASKLLANPKVATRVDALRKAIEKKHELSISDLIAELEESRSVAHSLPTPQLSAAIAATMGKAKMLGYLSDKVELTGKDGSPVQIGIQVSFVNPSQG